MLDLASLDWPLLEQDRTRSKPFLMSLIIPHSLVYHGYELKMNVTNSLENSFPITLHFEGWNF